MTTTETMVLKELTSKDGKKYAVSYPDEGDLSEKTTPQLKSKKDFGITVYWTPSPKDNWIPTAGDVIKIAAIDKYSLFEYNGRTYKYKLSFVNTEHYDYKFFDGTGDSYRCNTYRNGSHTVYYNSDDPTIKYIKGD